MSLEMINEAIQRHRDWVVDFNAALAGTGSKEFDLKKATDDTFCALGRWLSSAESVEILTEEFHARATAIHGTFHEISGEVVISLKADDPPEVTQGLVAALDDLSKSLIEFLEFAKRRLSGAPRNWST